MMDGNVSFELALEISARLGMVSSSSRFELFSWEARDGVARVMTGLLDKKEM